LSTGLAGVRDHQGPLSAQPPAVGIVDCSPPAAGQEEELTGSGVARDEGQRSPDAQTAPRASPSAASSAGSETAKIDGDASRHSVCDPAACESDAAAPNSDEASARSADAETVDEAVTRVNRLMGETPRLCVLSGREEPACAESRLLLKLLARSLPVSLGAEVVLVLGGCSPEVDRALLDHCSGQMDLWSVDPPTDDGGADDVRTAALSSSMDSAGRRGVLARIADVYMVLDSSPDVADQLRVAQQRGAFIVPLARTGCDSLVNLGVPATALQRPSWVPGEIWSALTQPGDSVVDAVAAAVSVITGWLAERRINLAASEEDSHQEGLHMAGADIPLESAQAFHDSLVSIKEDSASLRGEVERIATHVEDLRDTSHKLVELFDPGGAVDRQGQ